MKTEVHNLFPKIFFFCKSAISVMSNTSTKIGKSVVENVIIVIFDDVWWQNNAVELLITFRHIIFPFHIRMTNANWKFVNKTVLLAVNYTNCCQISTLQPCNKLLKFFSQLLHAQCRVILSIFYRWFLLIINCIFAFTSLTWSEKESQCSSGK